VLARRHPLERPRLHALQPGGTRKRAGEDEHRDDEQETDAPVRDAFGHRFGARST
jgi:hypothetical protein